MLVNERQEVNHLVPIKQYYTDTVYPGGEGVHPGGEGVPGKK